MDMDRNEIRRRIQENGARLYDSIKDETLQNLAGEIMSLNEDCVYLIMKTEDSLTIKAETILDEGFSINQKKWLSKLMRSEK